MPLHISLDGSSDPVLSSVTMHSPHEAALAALENSYLSRQTLAFVHRNSTARHALSVLRAEGLRAWKATTDQDPYERDSTLEAFNRGDLDVLVCTDDALCGWAATGVDLDVLHLELPPYRDIDLLTARLKRRVLARDLLDARAPLAIVS